MTHTMGVRAASFMTSAALLGLLVAAAFSVSITLQAATSGPPIISVPLVERPQEPPPVTPREAPPPQRPIQEDSMLDLPPIAPLDPDAPPQTTTIVFQDAGPSEITNPRWLRQPRDLARYYPPRALAREIPAVVSLDCLVDVGGALHCSVLSETPSGWGFGEAALRISRDYRMVPAMRGGQAVEGRYRMRVPFEVR